MHIFIDLNEFSSRYASKQSHKLNNSNKKFDFDGFSIWPLLSSTIIYIIERSFEANVFYRVFIYSCLHHNESVNWCELTAMHVDVAERQTTHNSKNFRKI